MTPYLSVMQIGYIRLYIYLIKPRATETYTYFTMLTKHPNLFTIPQCCYGWLNNGPSFEVNTINSISYNY